MSCYGVKNFYHPPPERLVAFRKKVAQQRKRLTENGDSTERRRRGPISHKIPSRVKMQLEQENGGLGGTAYTATSNNTDVIRGELLETGRKVQKKNVELCVENEKSIGFDIRLPHQESRQQHNCQSVKPKDRRDNSNFTGYLYRSGCTKVLWASGREVIRRTRWIDEKQNDEEDPDYSTNQLDLDKFTNLYIL